MKTVDTSEYDAVDDVLTYTYKITNTGNVTLSGQFQVTDDKIGDGVTPFDCGPADTELAPGEYVTCTATYTIDQADLDNGSVKNTAFASLGDLDSDPDDVTVNGTQNPELTVNKTVTSTGPYAIGDVITYQIDVKNIGNVTLHDVSIADLAAPFGAGTCDPSATLGVGETKTCTTSHTISAADFTAGSFVNTATGDSDETDPIDSTVTDYFNPAFTIVKTVTSTGPYTAGSTITYDIIVTNTGDVVLSDVTIADPGAVLGVCPVTGSLGVGETKTCSASYLVTAADVTAGTFTNTATASSLELPPTEGSATSTIIPTPTIFVPVTGGPTAVVAAGGVGGLIPVTGGNLIVSGLGHSCMPYNDQVICWGLNSSGQLGDGTKLNSDVAVYVKNLTGILNLTAGSKHTCALTIDGEVWCWGENGSGQLGNGTTDDSSLPVLVTGLPAKVVGLTAGENFTCTQLMNQEIWCWGENGNGQLNDGTTENQTNPVKTLFTTSFAQISGGQYLLLGNDLLGNVANWINVESTTIKQVSNALTVSANRWAVGGCAVTADGKVTCWGSDLTSALVPGTLTSLDVSAGLDHACAINEDQTVSCWGTNNNGELGNATFNESEGAGLVKNLSQVHAVAAGQNHTCILTGSSNTPMCWGDNAYGQLGNNSTTDSNLPVYVILPGQ